MNPPDNRKGCTLAALFCISCLLLTACANTQVTGLWKNSGYTGPPFRSLLVVGLTGKRIDKSLWENIMADRLRQNGLAAAMSVSVVPPGRGSSEREIISQAIAQGMDGVLVTRLVDTRTEQVYHPPLGMYYDGPYGYYGHYYRSYPYVYPQVYAPGYTSTFTTVLLETDLYEASSRQLIWSVSTATADFASVTELAKEVGATVVGQLRKDGLIR